MLYAVILENGKGSEKFEKITKIYLGVNNLSYFVLICLTFTNMSST